MSIEEIQRVSEITQKRGDIWLSLMIGLFFLLGLILIINII